LNSVGNVPRNIEYGRYTLLSKCSECESQQIARCSSSFILFLFNNSSYDTKLILLGQMMTIVSSLIVSAIE